MEISMILQTAIHKLETGLGLRFVRYFLIALLVVVVWGIYDLRCYRNMSAPEAMDAAQLGRNIARGRGFTTQFVRPFSIYLIRQKGSDPSGKDPARLNTGHPDIANAPAYPIVLAGLMKVLPFKYDALLKNGFWSTQDSNSAMKRRGLRYQPDFLIAIFNQVLFMVIIILAFFWARWLFDAWVAWTSVILLLGSELLWRFSVSGLSTMMLMLIVMCLVWCLTLLEREGREPKWGPASALVCSVLAGALTGIGGLTRYPFLWMIIPILAFIVIFGGSNRLFLVGAAIVAFAALMTPWLIRNYSISGAPFGIGSYYLTAGWLPEFRLERSLQPEIPSLAIHQYFSKLAVNLESILQSELFKMGGGWLIAFFLVGLLVGFRNPALRRMRYFVVAGIVVLAIVQALGRTGLSDETPDINSENLLVLLAPVVLVYGVGLFYVLLDSVKFTQALRYLSVGLFVAVLWLPMLFAILSPKKSPVAYPPYRPDVIQNVSQILKENEMMMSDAPWAVAWYGDRQSVWLTLNATVDRESSRQWQESFFAINDILKPINGLYLTPRSLDARLQSQLLHVGEWSWADFIVGALFRNQVPPTFPLTKMLPGYMPEQLVVFDTVRWL
jgi:hypothetical protein